MIESAESFDSGIPPGFAIATYRNTGNNHVPTVTYNGDYGAVDISQSGNSHGQWRFQNLPTFYGTIGCLDFDVSLDLEILPSASQEAHVGFHLRSGTGEEVWQLAQYINTDNSIVTGVWYGRSNGFWNSGVETAGYVHYATQAIRTGERGIIRVVREAGASLVSYYLNGELLLTFDGISASQKLRPDFLLYNTNVRVHEVIFHSGSYEDPQEKSLQFGQPTWANAETHAQAWPGDSHWAELPLNQPELSHPVTQVPHYSTPPIRAELGFIGGIVTVKSVPAPNRQVVCFDESMNIIAETLSGSDGHYQFDNLLRNRNYLVLAQDTFSFNYAPASADCRTPEAYP